jgi:hypothetical protein
MKSYLIAPVFILLLLLIIVGGVYGLRGPGGSAQVVHEMMADFSKVAAWVSSLWHSESSSSGSPISA